MGKSCWMASLAIKQLFCIQILLIFLSFKLLPNFIFQYITTDLKLGSSTYFFLLFLFLVLTKCQVLNLRVVRSCDQVLQRAYSTSKNILLQILQSNWLSYLLYSAYRVRVVKSWFSKYSNGEYICLYDQGGDTVEQLDYLLSVSMG